MSRPPAESRGAGSGPADTGARPPLGGWGRLYALVLFGLAVELVLLWLLTERYR